jgi:hypothetical protein
VSINAALKLHRRRKLARKLHAKVSGRPLSAFGKKKAKKRKKPSHFVQLAHDLGMEVVRYKKPKAKKAAPKRKPAAAKKRKPAVAKKRKPAAKKKAKTTAKRTPMKKFLAAQRKRGRSEAQAKAAWKLSRSKRKVGKRPSKKERAAELKELKRQQRIAKLSGPSE